MMAGFDEVDEVVSVELLETETLLESDICCNFAEWVCVSNIGCTLRGYIIQITVF